MRSKIFEGVRFVKLEVNDLKNAVKNINAVRLFWENNPLFQGESNFETGSIEYFHEHRRVYLEDCFAGKNDKRLFPRSNKDVTLDLGCGPGFWTTEFLNRGVKSVVASDLTHSALILTKKRLKIYDVNAGTTQANAELLPFKQSSFDHVNCLGVIHHTPNTEKCVAEIARILKSDGHALISVYYKNILIRFWPVLRWIGLLLSKSSAGLKGRGRENIFSITDVQEIVRQYDGRDNPIGKVYSKNDFINILRPYFDIIDIFYHFFPARALPIAIPKILHSWLDVHIPFMIFALLKKKA